MSKKVSNTSGKIIVRLLVKDFEECTYKTVENPLLANKENAKLQFFLLTDKEEYYLFEQRFSKGVYVYFKNGVWLSQIGKYKSWNRNTCLDKVIEEQIPRYTKYIMKEVA